MPLTSNPSPGLGANPSPHPTRVVVVGAGVFGRNHLRIYRELEQAGYPVHLAGLVEPNLSTADLASEQFGVPAYPSIQQYLAAQPPEKPGPHAASVCVPTLHHADVAAPLLAAGLDLLIEKPIAASLSEADHILALAAEHGRIVHTGHLERFNPAVTAARAHLNRPMFFEAHRLSIFTPRSLDVDVVLDLMIHDLDIVLSFVPSPVREIRAVGLPVLSPKVDIANVRLEFENGSVANFTASRVSTERVRKLRFFQPHQYLSLDFARQDLLLIDVTAAAGLVPGQIAPEQIAHLAATSLQTPTPGTQHPSPGLCLRKLEIAPGEPLRLEIETFLEAVHTRDPTAGVTAEAGRAALAVALAINSSIADHTRRTGLAR